MTSPADDPASDHSAVDGASAELPGQTLADTWGEPVAAADAASVAAWNAAWADALHFRGDPMARLADANRTDERFVLGSVFCAVYGVLAGARSDQPGLVADVERARARAATPRELAHVNALAALVAGDFVEAGHRWDAAADGTHDLAAVRFAHDVYLHCGADADRLASTTEALTRWAPDDPGYGALLGMHSFSLEEAGHYDDATAAGLEALARDPDDLWALHALAHVYEMTDDQDAAIDLLGGTQDRWRTQDLLATHIWWHLALRLIAAGDHDEVLAIHDALVPTATTAFRLCDLTSLLWRLELVGVEVGDRWDVLADRWAATDERHTCGFLDVHAAMVFARRPAHPGAATFLDGVEGAHIDVASENAQTFRTAVVPLVGAITAFGAGDRAVAAEIIDGAAAVTHRIGGSIAQRDVLRLTAAAARTPLTPGANP
jgi:tetratricopeptide (TPR) repeat protein